MSKKQPITIVLDDNPKGLGLGYEIKGAKIIGMRRSDALDEIEMLKTANTEMLELLDAITKGIDRQDLDFAFPEYGAALDLVAKIKGDNK